MAAQQTRTQAPKGSLSADERRFAALQAAFRRGRTSEDPQVAEMKANRRAAAGRKQGSFSSSTNVGSGALTFATGRPRDPLFYWKQNNLPYELTRADELIRLRAYCRLLYASHPVIASCVDIYTKYPLLGMELRCKDQKITDFYTELFLDEDRLNYPEFLLKVGREYWTCGEAWPFATFNEPLGIWEHEELLNPDDIEVQSSPFLRDPRFLIRLPQTLRDVITRREPAWEYEQLMAAYPELANYSTNDSKMPVSNILLRQLKFEVDTFNPRGVPILMRAMRAVMQEEMLNAAQDAIADRLYTPLLLARLGASATDLGTETPWVPTPDDLEEFEQALDAALAGDFRVLTYHFGLELDEVFGRESMPDLSNDFERLEGRILLSFGLSATLLTGAGEGETYAADALNKDLVSQLLTTYQSLLKRHYRQRALIVAEAQEHFDYEERGGKRYVKYEEILEIDEESGEETIVRQPKLLVPDMYMNTMSLSDDEQQRGFLEQLRETGVPISMRTRLTNIPISFEEELERSQDEQVQLAVAEQETRKRQYLELRNQGLPIPSDLREDFTPQAMQAQTPSLTEGMRTPVMGLDPGMPYPNLAPTPEDLAQDPTAAPPGMPTEPGADLAPEEDPAAEEEGEQRPEESDEQRGGMPKDAGLWRSTARMRELGRTYRPLLAEDGTVRRRTRLDEPRHIGLRRFALADADTPMADD